jgi:hypothetical protein
MIVNREKQNYSCNRSWRTLLWDVEVPTFTGQSAHIWPWGSQPYATITLYLLGRFLVLIYVTGWVNPRATMRLEKSDKLKKLMISSGIEGAIFLLMA